MTVENEKTINEKPATHQKKAQYLMIGLLVLIIVAVLISALFKSKTKVNLNKEKPKAVVLTKTSENQENFNDKFNKETLLNKNKKVEDNAPKENTEQLITKLKNKRDGLAKRLNRPNKKGGKKLDDWEKKERDRVRKSRYDDYKISLGFNKKNSSTLDKYKPKKRVSNVSAKKAAVQAEIARVTKLKNDLQNGNLTPEQVQARFANKSFNAFNEVEQPTSSQLISTNNRPRVVGQVRGNGDNINPNARLLPVATSIRASLDNKVISDYPSVIRCIVIENVYDATNQYILIPVGSKCNGRSLRINNVNEPIQARMGTTITNVILPNGNKIDFSKQRMLDREGIAAIKDEVDRHFLAQFLGVAAYALVSEETSREGSGALSDQTFSGEAGSAVRKQFAPLAAKYLRLVPTVTLNQGTPLRIFIEDELYIEPWQQVGESFVRNY